MEGYGADVENMKKKVAFYQKYIGKLKMLVEQYQEQQIQEELK